MKQRLATLIPHDRAFEPEVLGEAKGTLGWSCITGPQSLRCWAKQRLAMLIPHYRAFEPEVLGEAVGHAAGPAFKCG